MIRSLIKAFDLLESFDAAHASLSLAELSVRSGHPKTTLRTLLATLESRGYIGRVGQRYALGTAVIRLSPSAYVNLQIRDRAAPELRRLADDVGESVYLTVPGPTHVLYIYAIESSNRLEARSATGDLAWYHATSVGKALLAFLPPAERDRIIDTVGLPRRTDRTVTDRGLLDAELDLTRARGYATDNSENEAQTYCIGAPIFDADGNPAASCSISGSSPDVIGTENARLVGALLRTAEVISKRLGYVRPRDRVVPPAMA